MKTTKTIVDPDYHPGCDECDLPARWSLQNLEDWGGDEMVPTVRWFACGRHVHHVMSEGDWNLDAIQVMDLNQGETRS